MNKLKSNARVYCLIVFILFNKISLAQGPVFEEDVIDVPSTPINDWLIPTSIFAIGMVFYILKKRHRSL